VASLGSGHAGLGTTRLANAHAVYASVRKS
jgi:hypothetical protein